jgi:23S rRNA (cytosine1962-C5)-methyltransferase
VHEHGIRYLVRPGHGHKTGFFADQRDNRLWLATFARGAGARPLLPRGRFALAAAKGGARSVVAIDLDEEAGRADQGQRRPQPPGRRREARGTHSMRCARPARSARPDRPRPPEVGRRAEGHRAGIVRYRDLNRQALEKLEPGGLLVDLLVLGRGSEDRFLAMLRTAAADARRDLRILRGARGGPGPSGRARMPGDALPQGVFAQVR